jgi:glycosyltransferase involved in cell wall biosynthesis
MGDVFHASTDVRHARVAAGQLLLNNKFKWVHVAQRMVDAAHICAQKKHHKDLRIGWVATWNTRCGIATYSEHLINNMPADITILAAHSDSGISDDSANVCRCWTAGDHYDLSSLMHSIDKHRLDALVIQFNYGFFNFDVFKRFLDTQIEHGRIVVITLHATTDPAHEPKKKLSLLVPALRRCHRLLVHSPNDMNRLKQLGLVDNVTLFPHGVVDYISPVKVPFDSKRSFRIASYGFFLPHKGLLELIDATVLLRNRDLNIQLDMVNSAYPVPESANLIAQVTKKIENSGLQGIVSICTDFLNDLESLERLANADLIIFPYQDTGESASGAVRYGLASGRPVAVTPIRIFDDVENVVHYLPGQSAESIADGVALLMTKILADDRLISEKEESVQRWRHEHSYAKIGLRLYGMLHGLLINMDNFKE